MSVAVCVLGSACYLPFGPHSVAIELAEAMRDLDRAAGAEHHEDVLLVVEHIADLDAEPDQIVHANTLGLEAAIASANVQAMAPILPRLDAALRALGPAPHQGVVQTSDERLRQDAESAVRDAQAFAFDAWSGAGSDVARNVVLASSALYREHFGDSIEAADVLWRHAEFLRRDGQSIEAVALYEEVRQRDFLGKYGDKAIDRISALWTSASESTELPRDITERMEIPSPHREWIAIAQARLDRAQGDPAAWGIALRIAEIQLAYRQVDAGYSTLRQVIDRAADRHAVAAAGMLLEHTAAHATSRREFQRVRKELQSDKRLWADREFRSLLTRLRKKVEGR